MEAGEPIQAGQPSGEAAPRDESTSQGPLDVRVPTGESVLCQVRVRRVCTLLCWLRRQEKKNTFIDPGLA